MKRFQVMSIGAFIIAGAHYVRGGDDGWYVAWVATGVFLAIAGDWVSSLSSPQGTSK